MTMEEQEKNNDNNFDDLNYGRWANLSLQLSEKFDPLVENYVEEILEKAGKGKGLKNQENHKISISFILSNLLLIHCLDPSAYCLLKRGNNDYSSNSYNPNGVGIRALRRCFNFLSDNGFIEVRGGNFNRSGEGAPGGYVTRCRAQESLLAALSSPEPKEEVIGEVDTPGITRNTNLTNDPNSINFTKLFSITPLPIIRMKDDGKNYIETPSNCDLERMSSNLQRMNAFLEDHWIDLCIPDDELTHAFANLSVEEDRLPGNRSNLRSPYNIAMQRTLYRVFNNESFGQGGRFYGGWWQQIKSEHRRFITINWHPVSEIDYSNMQAALLYAREGLDLPNDAYEIEGIPVEYRKLIKTTFFKLINAEGQIRHPRQEELPDGWTFNQIMEALKEKHALIADYFNTGIGIHLQRIDSDIAEIVMLKMMDEGQLVLPVHDSFIVRTGLEQRLKEVMLEAYVEKTGREVQMETDLIWIEELTTEDDRELHELGVRDISENFSDLIHRQDYARYNQRRWDFVEYKGEEWGYTRQWFNG